MCSFCLLEPQHAVGAWGMCSCKSADLSIKVSLVEESGPQYPAMFRPLEEEGLSPLPPSPTSTCPQPLTSPSWNHSPMTLRLMLHWSTWRTFALIWLGQRWAGPPPPAQPPQACLSHFVFLRFGCGAQWASLQTHFLVESLLTAQCCELLGLLPAALLCSRAPSRLGG